MKFFTNWLRNYFGFSQIEIKGFILVSLVMILCLAATFYQKFFNLTPNYTNEIAQKDQETLQKWVAEINEHQKQYAEQHPQKRYESNSQNEQHFDKRENYDKKNVTYSLFAFNPNEASIDDFVRLGIPKYVATNIQNYRQKGGKFKIKADFKRIYGLKEEKYLELLPYIDLPEMLSNEKKNTQDSIKTSEKGFLATSPHTSNANPAYTPKKPVPFDFSKADTTVLKNIRGIGSVMAARIIKYRDNLGGFHSPDQLKEIYGLQPEVIEELLKYANFDGNITPIHINTAQEEQLKSHPYLNYKLAQVIVNYRKQHGKYKNTDDLLKIKILDASKIEKLKPYLVF
jgi:competence protein ComEA